MAKKIIILILAQILAIGLMQSTFAADDIFKQVSWKDGPSGNTAVSPTNKMGWTYYSNPVDTNIKVDGTSGAVSLNTQTLTVPGMPDMLFNASGTGIGRTNLNPGVPLTFDSTIKDPFVNTSGNLGQWTSLPEMPTLGNQSAFVKAGNYIYAIWSGTTFARYSIADETRDGRITWEFLASTPKPTGAGAALAYSPDTPDLIYATRGGNTKDFWTYTIPGAANGNSWTDLTLTTPVPYPVGAGGNMVVVPSKARIYLVCGNGTTRFLYYDLTFKNWKDGLVNSPTPRPVDSRCGLVHTGRAGDNYIHLTTSCYSWRFNITTPEDTNGWSAYPIYPTCENIYDLYYPGSGDYIYTWGYNYASTNLDAGIRYFGRLNVMSASPAWEDLTPTAAVPVWIEKGILYDPDGSGKLRLLCSANYTKTFHFNPNSNPALTRWDELIAPLNGNVIGSGADMCYNSDDHDTIYFIPGSTYKYLGAYSILPNKWSRKAFFPAGREPYYGACMCYYNGYVYCGRGYGGKIISRYDVLHDIWDPMTDLPFNQGENGSMCVAKNQSGQDCLYVSIGSSRKIVRWVIGQLITGSWDQSVADAPNTIAYASSLVCPDLSGDFIYVTGIEKSGYAAFYKYKISVTPPYTETTDPNKWTLLGYMPFPTSSNKSKLMYPGTGDYIYFMSGTVNQLARYRFKPAGDPTVGKWDILAAPPIYLGNGFVGCVKDNYIYAAGCYQSQYTMCKYDTSAGTAATWTERNTDTPLPVYYSGRYYPSYGNIIKVNNVIYMFYGCYNSHIWKYSLPDKKWVGIIKAPFLFTAGTKACYPGTGIYVYVVEGNNSDRFWRYNLSDGTWDNFWYDALEEKPKYLNGDPVRFYSGSQLAGNGDVIFAIPGADLSKVAEYPSCKNYKVFKYNITTHSWTMSGVPGFPDLKNYVNLSHPFGDRMIYVKDDSISMNRLYWTGYEDSFLWYWDVGSADWAPTSSNPGGLQARNGSSIYYCSDDRQIYYAGEVSPFSGYNYKKFYKYSVTATSNNWTELKSPARGMGYPDPFSSTGAYDADMFYYLDNTNNEPHLYFYDGGGQPSSFARYSINKNDWDQPATLPDYQCTQDVNHTTGSVFCEGPYGDTFYIGCNNVFYRYDISSRTWTVRTSPYASLGWSWNASGQQLVRYPGDPDSLFATQRGALVWDGTYYLYSNKFARYSINEDKWYQCNNPVSTNNLLGYFASGHCLAATPDAVYALLGQIDTANTHLNYPANKIFMRYDPTQVPQGTWYTTNIYGETLPSFPVPVTAGSTMVYVKDNGMLYAIAGLFNANGDPNDTVGFYKFDPKDPSYKFDFLHPSSGWGNPLSSPPIAIRAAYNGGYGTSSGVSLMYPDSGNYIYLLPADLSGISAKNNLIYRFNIKTETWDTNEVASLPEGVSLNSKMVYPGKGDYCYVFRGYNRQDILKFLIFKQGAYTSEVKNVGVNKGYNSVQFSDVRNGFFKFQARTTSKFTTPADPWDSVPSIGISQIGSTANGSGSLSGASTVISGDQSIQYRISLLTDDLNNMPVLNNLTISYDKYLTPGELISSSYDCGSSTNRIKQLQWLADALNGSTVKFQLRTSPDGTSSTWSDWVGVSKPTTRAEYDFSDPSVYSFLPDIKIVRLSAGPGTVMLTPKADGSYDVIGHCITPRDGAPYDSDNKLTEFQEAAFKPTGTEIKYQVSPNGTPGGINWYYWNGSAWINNVDGSIYANTAAEINAHLATFPVPSDTNTFFWMAFLKSIDGIHTPQLIKIRVTTRPATPGFYDTAGGNTIDMSHSDAFNDEFVQYKAILTSSGDPSLGPPTKIDTAPILNSVSVSYANPGVTVIQPSDTNITLDAAQTTYQVKWESNDVGNSTKGYTGKANLYYSKDDGKTYYPITQQSSPDGTNMYTWTIPNDPASNNAYVKIMSNDFPTVTDISDNPFTILSVHLTSPTANQEWELGAEHTVSWFASESAALPLYFYLSKDNGGSWSPSPFLIQPIGSPTSDSVTQTFFSDPSCISAACRIKITDSANRFDISPQFSIIDNPSITLPNPPDGGAPGVWYEGDKHNIGWTTKGKISPNLSIKYKLETDSGWNNDNDDASWSQHASICDSTAFPPIQNCDWTVPVDSVSAGQNSVNAKILVEETSFPSSPYRDTTTLQRAISAPFTIQLPTVNLTIPDATWVVGDTGRKINWTNNGALTFPLKLDYSLDYVPLTGNGTWFLIESFTEPLGSHSHTISTAIPSGAFSENPVYLRISDSRNNSNISNLPVSIQILSKRKVVLNPVPSSGLVSGQQYNVTWQYYGTGSQATNKLRLDWSGHNIITDKSETGTIRNGLPGDSLKPNLNTWTWPVPGGRYDQVKLHIWDTTDPTVSDETITPFTIGVPIITFDEIDVKNTGTAVPTTLFSNGLYVIKWEGNGTVGPNFDIKYSYSLTTPFDSCSLISSSATPSGNNRYQCDWRVPIHSNSTPVYIFIKDLDHPDVAIATSGQFNFNIRAPVITVTSPNFNIRGLNAWIVGTTGNSSGQVPISWDIEGVDEGSITSLNINLIDKEGNPPKLIATVSAPKPVSDSLSGVFILAGTYYSSTDALASIVITDPAGVATCTPDPNQKFQITGPTVNFSGMFDLHASQPTLILGKQYTINWYSNGAIATPLTIKYFNGTSWDTTPIQANINDPTGSTTWTPLETGTPAAHEETTGVAKFMISDNSDPAISSPSHPFYVAYPTLTVKVPTSLCSTTDIVSIDWDTNSDRQIGSFLAEWSKDGLNWSTEGFAAPAIGLPPTTGSVNWTIPEIDANNISQVKIRITDQGWGQRGNGTYKVSGVTTDPKTGEPCFFPVHPVPKLYLRSPTANQCWRIGNTYPITWKDNGGQIVGPGLTLKYSTDKGQDGTWKDIYYIDGTTKANNVPPGGDLGDRTFQWKIPHDGITPGTQCEIQIQDNGTWKGSKTTVAGPYDPTNPPNNCYFEIGAPTLTITAPSQTPIFWAVGETPTISWTSDGYIHDAGINLNYKDTLGSGGAIAAGLSNTPSLNAGSYDWQHIPNILDGNNDKTVTITAVDAGAPYTVVSPPSVPVTIIAKPDITMTSTLSSQYYLDLSNVHIAWQSRGISIAKVKIDYSTNDFAPPNDPTTRLDIATVTNVINGTCSYDWKVPAGALTGANLKIRITGLDSNDTPLLNGTVSAESTSFAIKGGFNILYPAGGEHLIAGKTEALFWKTTGGIGSIRFYYYDGTNSQWYNFDGTNLNPVTGAPGSFPLDSASLTNTTSPTSPFNFKIPKPSTFKTPTNVKPVATARIYIESVADSTVFAQSGDFNVDFYKVSWNIVDSDNGGPIQPVDFVENYSGTTENGWNQQSIYGSPITRYYPCGDSYVTQWVDSPSASATGKSVYYYQGLTWTSDADNKSITVALQNQNTALMDWHVILSTTYDAVNNKLDASTWLEKKGTMLGGLLIDNLLAAKLEIFDGTTLKETMTYSTPGYDMPGGDSAVASSKDANGVFKFIWVPTTLVANKNYFVKATIVYGPSPTQSTVYTSGASIDITQALANKAQADQLAVIQTQAAMIQTQTTAIQTAVEQTIPNKIDETKGSLETKIDSAKTEIKADTSRILTAAETTIPTQIREKVETVLRSEILNRESVVRLGTKFVIRYRTPTNANAMPVIDVYDPNNLLVTDKDKKIINKQPMALMSNKEALATMSLPGMSVYQYELQTSGSWPYGDYTIICSDPTTGTMDALMVAMLRTDLEDIASQASTILGTTTSLSNLKDVADTLNSQFSIIESALGKISTDLVNKVKEVASASTDIESVYTQLVNIGKELKTLGASQDVNLSKLLDVSRDKKQDMMYLKNKTQELKAVMDLNQKMIDNMAHKPVTQTWFEYK